MWFKRERPTALALMISDDSSLNLYMDTWKEKHKKESKKIACLQSILPRPQRKATRVDGTGADNDEEDYSHAVELDPEDAAVGQNVAEEAGKASDLGSAAGVSHSMGDE